MAEKRKVVLTGLANQHITAIYQSLTSQGATVEAEELINDFLDVVFGEIPRFPDTFPVCEAIYPPSDDYRIGSIVGDFRIIFQIMKDRVIILMILHESELPF